MRILTYYDAAILNQVRMGYLTLKSDEPWKNMYTCTCDNQPRLTIKHFLLECTNPEVVEIRNEMRAGITSENNKFQDDDYFYDVNHLLYPHLEYSAKELKKFENITLRTTHLQWVIEFCRYRFPD